MANIREVAEQAGVSVTTASFVLSGRAEEYRISDGARAKVEAAAEALNYRPNYHARTFKRGRADVIGYPIILEDSHRYEMTFWQGILAGIDLRAREDKFDVLLIGGADTTSSIQRAYESVQNRQVDALICPYHAAPWLRRNRHYDDMPIVYVGAQAQTAHPQVALDPEPGLRAGVEHLRELGHRSLHYAAIYPPGEEAVRSKLLEAIAAEAGLRFGFTNLWSEGIGDEPDVAAFVDLVRRNATQAGLAASPPGAIFCFNDLCALGVQAALDDAGLRVPDDVSLIGFDDIYAQSALPQLTVVSHMLEELGRTACELALSMVGRPKVFTALRNHTALVPSALVPGRSTAAPSARVASTKRESATDRVPG